MNRRRAKLLCVPSVPRLCRPCRILAARPRRPWHTVGGFTLIELLVTITIIAMLAGMSLAALQAARQTAREAKTRALITKLDHVISQRYESYKTRRVRIPTRDIPRNDPNYLEKLARRRLDALRDLMRMELPERWSDIYTRASTPGRTPWQYSWGSIPRPAVSELYLASYRANEPSAEFGPAECLYMIVALGTPGAMEDFSQTEIGDADGDGFPEFHDGWGRPVMFLRWAPGFSYGPPYNGPSEIQSGDPIQDHDPLDTRNVDSGAFAMTPLIYSAGRDKQYDLEVNKTYAYDGDPYSSGAGTPVDPKGDGANHHDNIHNHYQAQN